MAVIVNSNMSIDQALRLLWREVKREGVIETLKDRRYYIKPTTIAHDKRKVWAKTKKRRAAQKRKFRNKGYVA